MSKKNVYHFKIPSMQEQPREREERERKREVEWSRFYMRQPSSGVQGCAFAVQCNQRGTKSAT